MALTDKLSAIGDAIREKTGGTELLTLDAMPTAISSITTGGGSGNLNEDEMREALTFRNVDCCYTFAYNKLNSFLEKYGQYITMQKCECWDLFYNSYELSNTNISQIGLRQTTTNYNGICNMFSNCSKLKEIPELTGAPMGYYYMYNAFSNCYLIKEIKCDNLDLSLVNLAGSRFQQMFSGCYSLREIPNVFLNLLRSSKTGPSSYKYTIYYGGFSSCYVLDKLENLPVYTNTYTTNIFQGCFSMLNRLNTLTFQDSDNSTLPTWKNQTIDLSNYVGYANTENNITGYNSGLTNATRVIDDATYQALKDNPDYWTTDVAYSHYNHDSAVETINSLPDVSGGTSNTIKFKGEAGSATDSGAINTLTEEEIAVATAKGWTVSFT